MTVVELPRRTFTLGGSTLPAAAGVDPYTDPIMLWLELTGRWSKPESEAMRWGKRLEPLVAVAVHDDATIPFQYPGDEFRDVDRPWLVGHTDGMIGDDLLEIKSTATARHLEAPPLHWQAQCQTYLHLTGLDRALLAVLCSGSHLQTFELERDDEAIGYLLDAGERFVGYLERDERPPVDHRSREALLALYPHAGETRLRADKQTRDLIRLAQARREQEEAAHRQREAIENEIRARMGDANVLVGPDDTPLVRWSNVTSRRIDTARLKTERPDVYQAWSAETTTRRFTIL